MTHEGARRSAPHLLARRSRWIGAPLVALTAGGCVVGDAVAPIHSVGGTPRVTAIPAAAPPRTTGDLVSDLAQLCWSVRIECEEGQRGRPAWTVTAKFNSPEHVLSTDSVSGCGSSAESALDDALRQVRLELGIRGGSSSDLADREERLLRRLAAGCSWFRLDCNHASRQRASYDLVARASLAADADASSTIVRGASLENAVSRALSDLGV